MTKNKKFWGFLIAAITFGVMFLGALIGMIAISSKERSDYYVGEEDILSICTMKVEFVFLSDNKCVISMKEYTFGEEYGEESPPLDYYIIDNKLFVKGKEADTFKEVGTINYRELKFVIPESETAFEKDIVIPIKATSTIKKFNTSIVFTAVGAAGAIIFASLLGFEIKRQKRALKAAAEQVEN